ncbi:hypothetical protein EJP82_20835 [Paenibacillus anaericanus]|uniref:Uncharacterized protein n=1 Tax=Paenibacillus anaericanus TaxID=170367 RepID=A0A3S1EDH6_9BACL|nr:hypothetical protein [Paenibacillus anaericanus]RUT43264.1 hypothetical protein EJP82_20835 [Paenibacillus anaericanus]
MSKNVKMGPNATISWGQVTSQPRASDLGGLMDNSPKLTYIDANGIYTGSLTADQIRAGKISANYIKGGIISGVDIDVENGIKVGNTITVGKSLDQSLKSIKFTNSSGITCKSDAMTISADTLHFACSSITGITATFG